MPRQRVTIYEHPNPEMKSFFTTEDISAPRLEHFQRRLESYSETALKSLGLIGAQIVREIMGIPWVKEIRIKPKEIRMTKEIASSWGEIEDRVVKVLDRALRKKKIEVVGPPRHKA